MSHIKEVSDEEAREFEAALAPRLLLTPEIKAFVEECKRESDVEAYFGPVDHSFSPRHQIEQSIREGYGNFPTLRDFAEEAGLFLDESTWDYHGVSTSGGRYDPTDPGNPHLSRGIHVIPIGWNREYLNRLNRVIEDIRVQLNGNRSLRSLFGPTVLVVSGDTDSLAAGSNPDREEKKPNVKKQNRLDLKQKRQRDNRMNQCNKAVDNHKNFNRTSIRRSKNPGR